MYILIDQKKIKVYSCKTFYSRFIGLMFKENFNYCLQFEKCRSIHTFFMKTKIDVIMTDINNNVLYIYKNLKPWKIILPKKNVYTTYELPAGTIKNNIKKIIIKD